MRLCLVSLKVRERELAKFDDDRQATRMLNTMHDENEVKFRGREGKTPVTTAMACSECR